MSERWFFRQRQEWIALMLRVYGFINRRHLQKMFEISHVQATADLQHFLKKNPGVMIYNSAA